MIDECEKYFKLQMLNRMDLLENMGVKIDDMKDYLAKSKILKEELYQYYCHTSKDNARVITDEKSIIQIQIENRENEEFKKEAIFSQKSQILINNVAEIEVYYEDLIDTLIDTQN